MPDFVRELPFEVEAALYEKEAMAEFAKENDKGGDCEGVNNILRRGMRIVRKARELINAPTIQQPEWISCAERLPNPHEDVLVYDKTVGEIAIGCLSLLGEWFGVPMKNKASHWMPLPQPPKEDE